MGAILAIAVSRVASWDDINQNTDWGVLLLFGGGLTLSAILKKQTGANAFLAEHSPTASPPCHLRHPALPGRLRGVPDRAGLPTLPPPPCWCRCSPGWPRQLGSPRGGVRAHRGQRLLRLHAAGGHPPSTIVFASGHIQQREMMQAGLVLNLVFTRHF